ncbi:MAG: MFS transporter [Armatimonadetes bacterium]|nr:MFS transporter [Armatimonadota bacterium]
MISKIKLKESMVRIRPLAHEYRSLLMLASAALLAELAYAVLNLSAMPMYVDKSLNLGKNWGFIFGTFLAVEALSRPALGALGDRIGRKPLMLAGPLITAITSYLTIVYRGPYVLYYLIGLRVLDGLGSSALWMNAFAAVGDLVDDEHRSAALSVLNVTYMGGMALGFLLGGGANDYFHTLKASFYLASILFVLSFLVLLVFFPKLGKPHHVDIPGHETPPDFKPEHILRSFKEVPDMVVMAMVTFLGMGMLTPIVKLYAIDHLMLTETQFGVAVAPIAAFMGIFAIPLGHLGDKYGKTSAVCWGLFASSIAMWVLALTKFLPLIGIAGILIGLGFTVAFPAWNALVISATDPKRRGEVLGAVGLAQGLAAMAGTLVGPLIYKSDALSFPKLGVINYNVPFWISAILITAGTVISFTWVCNRRSTSTRADIYTCRQKHRVVSTAFMGLIILSCWIGYRYTMPIATDRVAWVWVQQLARNKVSKALNYSVESAPGWNGAAEAKIKAKEYHGLVHDKAASYVVRAPEYLGKDRAEVEVVFNIPSHNKIFEKISLCKTKPRGDWKVCGVSELAP